MVDIIVRDDLTLSFEGPKVLKSSLRTISKASTINCDRSNSRCTFDRNQTKVNINLGEFVFFFSFRAHIS